LEGFENRGPRKGGKGVNEEREARASKTNVTRLDYLKSGSVTEENCTTPEKLIEELNKDAGECQIRLFVVEDLSRDVIEALGDNLDIEPVFFREHIHGTILQISMSRLENSAGFNFAM
jgi:hypothetical protein